MIRLLKPLSQGDTVCLLAPSGKASEKMLADGIRVLESWGLKTKTAQNALNHYPTPYYTFAGTDQERYRDLQQALDDPETAAILCLRGGYGMTRIQDKLNFSGFEQAPKWVIGFSDISALHFQLRQAGFASLHATTPKQFEEEGIEGALASLKSALWGEAFRVEAEQPTFFRTGEATAPLVGGNLSILVNALGTPTEPDLTGVILLLEDIGEAPYAVDRMLFQLRRSGKLGQLAGAALGTFTNGAPENKQHENSIKYLLDEHFQPLGIPFATDFPIGHTVRNQAVILGAAAHLRVQAGRASLDFPKRNSPTAIA